MEEKDLVIKKNKLFRKIVKFGLATMILGGIIIYLLTIFTNTDLLMLMMVWIIATIVIIIAALIEDLDEDVRELLKEHIIETKLLREEISILKSERQSKK
ncbi:MAG: hypothetical protein ACP5OZ_00905 [Candidatus Woesearchaeota archaeon]